MISCGRAMKTKFVDAVGHRVGYRKLMRAPIPLYRSGFGLLLGTRLLMMEHRGRQSGQRRFAVLMVLQRPARDVYIVSSVFGERSQWFRNIAANPEVRVSTGFRRRQHALAEVLSPAEADDVLSDYRRRHLRAWALHENALTHTLGEPVRYEDTNLPMVVLRLRPALCLSSAPR
jgi:deazaflavin-dependent oxidoreductase (nitroreductase family)